jgi:hypothetical protein
VTASSSAAQQAPAAAADPAELSRLGIRRVATEYFLVGPYRYSSLADAIAEARRGRATEQVA